MIIKIDQKQIEIMEFDPINGSDEEWQRYFDYRRKKSLEENPNDPISSDESTKNSIQQNVQSPELKINLYSVVDRSTGQQIGDAQVSSKHANFIVNLGQARAVDVLRLIKLTRQAVKKRFGVHLELEIKLIGFSQEEING